MPEKKIKHLIVDTSAFIKNAPLQDMAENIYTIQEVIDEVTSKRQLRRLIVLPYDINVRNVYAEDIHFVTEFTKKTGDYPSLSATDIKVMAATYRMEIEKNGSDHLKTEPTVQKFLKITGLGKGKTIVKNITPASDQSNGENQPKAEETIEEFDKDGLESNKEMVESEETGKPSCDSEGAKCSNENTTEDGKNSEELDKEILDKLGNMNLEVDNNESKDILVKAESSDDESDSEDDEDESESDSDGSEWITPSNIQEKKKEMELGEFEDKNVEVACITTDFAMQNVMKQIGLNITSLDGRIIKHVRTFILRCTTCFKTTSIMTKVFCPKCGHDTLRKVAVSVDKNGKQQIHINAKKPLTARGKRFSLPTPRGGQHFQYPIITSDQKIRERKPTKLSRKTNNPLDPDYIAGFSPFVMRDVNSRAAVLGVRADKQDMKEWLRKQASHMRNKRK